MNVKIPLLLLLLIATIGALWIFQDLFSLAAIKTSADNALHYVKTEPLKGALVFSVFYFIVCALPTPFTSVPTMLAGYLFGSAYGLLIVSFTSALGGTCLFLISRYLLKDLVRQKVQHKITQKFPMLQHTVHSNSVINALTLRLIPGMPFSIPAIILSISQLDTIKFYISTQLGLLAILFVYVNAGQSLINIHSLHDVFSISLILSLLLLALMPSGFKWILNNRLLSKQAKNE